MRKFRSILVVHVISFSTLIPAISMAAPERVACHSVLQTELQQQISAWNRLSKAAQAAARKYFLFARGQFKNVARVPHVKTSGFRHDASPDMDPDDFRIDTADPSLVMPIYYPNGVTKYRINFSGLRYIEANSPADLFKPGIRKIQRSRGFYKDGTEMIGAYHTAAWPWDVVIYRNDQGELIALGGVMKQPAPGKLPNVAEHNATRSRWWGTVKHIEVSPGVYEERIYWQSPVHDFNVAQHKGWVYHGYGGTLVTEFNPISGVHEPVKNESGNYTLMYERVTEERNGLPWLTTTFMREIDPSLKFTVGPEMVVSNIHNPETGKIFDSLRRGDEKETTGYLREGDNVFHYLTTNQYMKFGSGNDYVRQYGIFGDYRDPNTGFFGAYKNVLDKNGELLDFATTLKLREIFNATWVGRPQLNYDPNGKMWLSFHFVPKDSIPEGAPHEGWPSAKEFPHYARLTGMMPVKIVYDKKGQPLLVADIDPQYAHFYEVNIEKKCDLTERGYCAHQ